MWLVNALSSQIRVSFCTYHLNAPGTGFASTTTSTTASTTASLHPKPSLSCQSIFCWSVNLYFCLEFWEQFFFLNSSSWQYSSYCWKSLFFLVNVTTFVSKMHLWHEPQSRPKDPWKICQIFSASARLFCKWLLFGRLDNSSRKKQDIGNLAMYLLEAQAVCGGTTHSHNTSLVKHGGKATIAFVASLPLWLCWPG